MPGIYSSVPTVLPTLTSFQRHGCRSNRHEGPCHLRKRVRRNCAVAQLVSDGRIEPTGDEDEVRFILLRNRQHYLKASTQEHVQHMILTL